MTTVSVIIPTYNRAHLVGRAIESVLAQTWRNLQLILVDDASTDTTAEVIEPYLADERVVYVRHPVNRGGSAARNTGIEKAVGRFVAFLDSDDRWRPNKLEKQLRVFEESSPFVGLVYTGFRKIGAGEERRVSQFKGDVSRRILVHNFVGTTSTPLIAKDVLNRAGLFDEELPSCQDWDMWIRLSRICRFEYVDEELVLVYRQPDSISNNLRATVDGHERLARKHAESIASLDSEDRAEHYFRLGVVYWWKGDHAAWSSLFRRAVCTWPAILPKIGAFLLLRPLKKMLSAGSQKWSYKRPHSSLRRGSRSEESPEPMDFRLRENDDMESFTLLRESVPNIGERPTRSAQSPPGSKPVRLLHLIEHLQVGGAERMLGSLVRGLDQERFESTVILYRSRGIGAEQLVQAGYKVVFIPKDILTRRFPNASAGRLWPLTALESLPFVLALARQIRKHRIDIVHAHMFSADFWGRLASVLNPRVVLIATEHTRAAPDSSLKHRLLKGRLLRSCDRVAAVTGQVADALVHLYRVPARKLRVIPNGIPIEPTPCNTSEDLPVHRVGGGPVVLAVGRLVEVKRFDLFVEAMRIVAQTWPGLSAWILGEGPERATIERLIREKGLERNVFLAGLRHDLPQWFKVSDVVVNSSDREGLPLSLLEAMAAARPVVATAVGGTVDLIRNDCNGLLVEPGNAEALADAVCRLIADPELGSRLALEAEKLVKAKYSLESMVKSWSDLYLEALHEKRG